MNPRTTLTALTTAALLAAGITGAAAPVASTVAASGCTPSWHLVPVTPLPGGPQAVSSLGAPASISRTDTWFPSSTIFPVHTGMLRWNGRSVVTAPEPPSNTLMNPPDTGLNRSIQRASFDSSTDGWVLGWLSPVRIAQPYLAHWDGSRWTITPPAVSPDPQTVQTYNPLLYGVAAVSPASAWAVGSLFNRQTAFTDPFHGAVIEHWDGTQWTLVPNPASATDGADLSAITAVSPSDIWAVGRQNNASGVVVPLIEHWDGTAWSVVPTPAVAAPSALYAVGGSGAGDAWAVGDQTMQGTTNTAVPLIEHWDGTAWTVVTSLPDIGNARATGVYAASPTDVWVTNVFPFHSGTPEVFLHWDGTSWTTVPVPGPQEYGVTYAYSGISGSGPGDVWASGEAAGSSGSTALIAHLTCG